MLFTLFCAGMVLLVLAAVSLPLLSGGDGLPTRGQYDRAVYRDQLREVDRDAVRGVLSPEEADAARLEIQRRLLAVDGIDRASGWRAQSRSPVMAIVASLFVVLGAGGLYWRLGAPTLTDAPYAARPAPEANAVPPGSNAPASAGPAAPHTDMRQAAEKLELKLAADPNNAEGWVLYARTTSMLGDWQKAGDAYKRALDLGQKGSEVYAGYGEMQVMAADGIVTPGAREAFNGALAKDPRNSVARFYLALADAQAGELPKAIDAWVKLAADVPDDTDMREEIARRVAEAAKLAGVAPPPLPAGRAIAAASAAVPVASAAATAPPAGGPDAAAVAAAANMAPEQRDTMQLADRLDKNPDDADGWLKLGRAYLVLKQPNKAADAYNRAAQMRPADPGIKLLQASALLDSLDKDVKVPDQVVQLLQQAQAADPNRPEVYWYLGIAAAHGGNRDDARQQWQHVLSMLPAGDEDRGVVQDAINSLN